MLRNHLALLSPFFFFFFFSVSLSNPIPRDTLALLAFKASSDNYRSNSLASWAESTDPCAGSWLGVTCDPNTRRVTKLVLENLILTGSIQPLTTGLDRLRLLSLNHNFLSSSLNFSSWPHLKHIYLSHNNFTGAFPAAISGLRNLRRLDLSHNQLSGEIPVAELTRLSKLLTLRLESNSLTGFGRSPSEAFSVPFTDFNVSNNNLAGEVPIFLEKFGAASFSGNKLLCGKPLHQDCPNPTAVKPPSSVLPPEAKLHSNNHVVLISVSVALGLMVVAGGVVRWRKSKKKSGGGEIAVTGGKPKLAANGCSYVKRQYGPRELQCGGSHSLSYGLVGSGPRESEEMVVLEGCNPGVGKVGDLLKASAELLGKGSVGATYKIMMDGRDDTMVVKRVRERRVEGKEVEAWLKMVGELKHPNIVSLRAYHNSSYELLLVYDFFGNGSLHSLLHGFRGPGTTRLDWSTRMKLALGCAAGLAFIHGSGKGKLYHGHINSCNVFIDDTGNACVADIGLQQLMVAQTSSCDAYKAPELMAPSSGFSSSSKYTRKCDVYSFGVVLMEILTGRMAGQEGEMSLVEWINTAVKKECGTWEVFDFELLSDKEMEEEMWALFQVGLLCLGAQPKDRPTMNMVVNMMEDIRKKGVRADGTRSILDDISYDTSSASQSTP